MERKATIVVPAELNPESAQYDMRISDIRVAIYQKGAWSVSIEF